MQKIPFSQDEMMPIMVQLGFPGCPDREIFTSPITPKENFLSAMSQHECLFVPYERDIINMNTSLIPDNRARATVMDGGPIFIPDPNGELDAFGIPWLYEPKINGSMVMPGKPILKDIKDWESAITFPNPECWDWKAEAERTIEYRSDSRFPYMSTIFTGFFERLISWMDFENAAIAMIDDEQQEHVRAVFDRLADLYCAYIDHFKNDFGVDGMEIHDDWGSQQSLFMSEDTYRETVFPYMKRVMDHAHSLGLFTQLHSCGKIEKLIPMMIDLGVDTWMGQMINDKADIVAKYGDKITIQVELPELPENASYEKINQAAEKFAHDFIIPGKPVMISIYSSAQPGPSALFNRVYEISRKKYSV